MSEQWTVSVVMAVWNRQRYIAEAVESVLAQTFSDFELIAVDDGSTDRSLQILNRYARRDARVRVIRQDNAGCYAARNRGLAESRGKYTAVIDSDDIMLPERLAKQVAFLEAHPDHVAVGSWMDVTDPHGLPIRQETPPETHDAIDAVHMAGAPGALIHGTALIRTEALRQLGGYREVVCGADYELALRLAEVGRLANLPEVLQRVRTHLRSISSTRRREQVVWADRFRRETHERRGLAVPSPVHALEEDAVDSTMVLTPAQQLRSWALHAIRGSRRRLACRYAADALWRDPLHRDSWRIMRWAILG